MKVIYHKKRIRNIFSFFKIIIIFLKIKQILLASCDYDNPILRSNSCNRGCPPAQIEEKNCNINNTLIQTQFLNNIVLVSPGSFKYVDITTTLKGDLLIESSSQNEKYIRYFYGLKKDGKGYYKDKIINKDINNYSITSSTERYQSFIFTIKLNDIEDDNEYLVSITKDASRNIELYDFNNDTIYEKKLSTFFHSFQAICIRASVIKISNSDNYYILGITGKKYDNTGTATLTDWPAHWATASMTGAGLTPEKG